MNAYELADELDWMTEEKIVKWCNDVANMLRQQADRIAELEKESANLEHSLKNALIFIDNAKQSEPVALIKQGKYGYPMLVFNGVFKYDSIVVKQLDIPLYTTPHHASDVKQTKPLSDEEIYEFADQAGFNVEGKAINDGIETAADFHTELFNFARAIEAKVKGEK